MADATIGSNIKLDSGKQVNLAFISLLLWTSKGNTSGLVVVCMQCRQSVESALLTADRARTLHHTAVLRESPFVSRGNRSLENGVVYCTGGPNQQVGYPSHTAGPSYR